MPATKKSKKPDDSNGAGPMTRSKRDLKDRVDITTYTTLNSTASKSGQIQVVSKRVLKSDPKHYEELEKKFEAIEAKRIAKEESEKKKCTVDSIPISPDVWNRRNTIFFVTHLNVFLYATCFFIQVGTLPVNTI